MLEGARSSSSTVYLLALISLVAGSARGNHTTLSVCSFRPDPGYFLRHVTTSLAPVVSIWPLYALSLFDTCDRMEGVTARIVYVPVLALRPTHSPTVSAYAQSHSPSNATLDSSPDGEELLRSAAMATLYTFSFGNRVRGGVSASTLVLPEASIPQNLPGPSATLAVLEPFVK